ncbi:hypothetical protein MGG_15543 [Pyricularia oryzae 70-15]|uniref:Uncharacterized protein n=1 Tax=Pyricularia oryzae (strain 70-15 / ATCC MYA-4617 / FGSC 8958) TaxID=242507 RepID=G4MSE9_PYRO7|nr:uncharacterized protein MGG_15543 [Pyricularia oryzae 70-15]EHA53761.1 hypothetical protein MGG_15543 [Pyricularia oryzae 70-15]
MYFGPANLLGTCWSGLVSEVVSSGATKLCDEGYQLEPVQPRFSGRFRRSACGPVWQKNSHCSRVVGQAKLSNT